MLELELKWKDYNFEYRVVKPSKLDAEGIQVMPDGCLRNSHAITVVIFLLGEGRGRSTVR